MEQSEDGSRAGASPCAAEAVASPGAGRSLLLVDDDARPCAARWRARWSGAGSVLAAEGWPRRATMRTPTGPSSPCSTCGLTEGSGLDLVRTLRELRPRSGS